MCVRVCVEIINTKEGWYVSRVFVAVHRGNPHMCFLYNGDCSHACSGARGTFGTVVGSVLLPEQGK